MDVNRRRETAAGVALGLFLAAIIAALAFVII